MGNISLLENALLRTATDELRRRLPNGWALDMVPEMARPGRSRDGRVRVRAPDGRATELRAVVKQRLDPRSAADLAAWAGATTGKPPTLAVARWMSRATRERLVEGGLCFVDLTGNARIVLAEPGLFIETTGAERDPWPEERRATLKGAKAARVARCLCAGRPPIGVRELAQRAATTPGYVSKLLGMLDEEAVVERSKDGRVASVDLGRLLARWAEDAPLESRSVTTSWIDPRGLPAFLGKLGKTNETYAVTGSLAAARRAPVAAPRLASVYTEDADLFASTLGLRPAEAGVNVLLLAPDDAVVFEDTWLDDEVRYAALPQVAADLLSGPGRSPAEAEALIAWMVANPEVWRG